MTDYTSMTVDELVSAYNVMLVKADAKFERDTSPLVVDFPTKTEGINRCIAIEALLEDRPVPVAPTPRKAATKVAAEPAEKAEEPEKEKKAMAKKAKKKVAKKKVAKKTAKTTRAAAPRTKGLELVCISSVADNPRRKGTGGYDRYAAMAAYVKKHPKPIVADVIKATSYTTTDFNWDKERDHIEVAAAK